MRCLLFTINETLYRFWQNSWIHMDLLKPFHLVSFSVGGVEGLNKMLILSPSLTGLSLKLPLNKSKTFYLYYLWIFGLINRFFPFLSVEKYLIDDPAFKAIIRAENVALNQIDMVMNILYQYLAANWYDNIYIIYIIYEINFISLVSLSHPWNS